MILPLGRRFIIIIVLLLAGCDVFAVPQTPTATLRGAVVPTRIPTATPTPTHTPSRTPTRTPTFTVTPITPTATHTRILTDTATRTPTFIPTIAASPTPVVTFTATQLPRTSATPFLVLTNSTSTSPTARATVRTNPTLLSEIIQIENINSFSYSETIERRNVEFWFSFAAEKGAVFSVQMTANSGDLDPYLLLLDASGETLIENDDDPQGNNRDAYIRDFVLPETGQYFIIATRFRREQGSTTGDFTLQIVPTTPMPAVTLMPAATEDADSIESGKIIEGTIDDDNPIYEYVVEVDAAATIDIELTALSGNLDPYLLVLDADGEVLFENDDDPQGTGRDSYLRAIQLPQAGEYTIIATRFQQAQGSTRGDFQLRFVILEE